MIRFLFLRLLVPLILYLVVRAALKSVFSSLRSPVAPQPSAQQTPPVQPGGELKKDPVCGTYVSTTASVTRTVDGKVLHFCSKECRDRYRAA